MGWIRRAGCRRSLAGALRLALLGCSLALYASSVRAQTETATGWAGLVIVSQEASSGDEPPLSFCISLSNPQTTGLDLLDAAGIDYVADHQGALGTAVCQIDGVGCAFPAEDCFCSCQGAECVYWSYYKLDPDGTQWHYAQSGASSAPVQAGSVDGWIWATGQDGRTDVQPPAITFGDICTSDRRSGRDGPPVGAAPPSGQARWQSYAGFGVSLLVLAILGLFLAKRK